eukprot:14799799-Heterocapsa_arctica.AAC.1
MAIAAATNNVWMNAVKKRRDLDGLTGPVDWTIPRKMLKHLDAKAPNDAGALRNILAGGTWPQARLAEVVPDTPLLCQTCLSQDEDEFHRWYICGSHNGHRKDYEWIRTKAHNELNRVDVDTGEDKPFRRHLWIRGLPQMIDVGKPLESDFPPPRKSVGK